MTLLKCQLSAVLFCILSISLRSSVQLTPVSALGGNPKTPSTPTNPPNTTQSNSSPVPTETQIEHGETAEQVTTCTSYETKDECTDYKPIKPVGQLPPCSILNQTSLVASNTSTDDVTIFAVIGDYGLDTYCAQIVANLFQNLEQQYTQLLGKKNGFDFVLSTGDNAYWGGSCNDHAVTEKYYSKYYKPSTQVNTPTVCSDDIDSVQMPDRGLFANTSYGLLQPHERFFATIGNHDWDDFAQNHSNMSALPYFQHFPYMQQMYGADQSRGEFVTQYINPSIQLFVMNSNYGNYFDTEVFGNKYKTLHDQQVEFIKHEMDLSVAPFKVLLFHHPPYSTAQHDHLAEWMNLDFESWNTPPDIVMVGHQHAYEVINRPVAANKLKNQPAFDMPFVINGLGGHSWVYAIENCEPAAGSQKRYNHGHGLIVGVMHTPQSAGVVSIEKDDEPIVAIKSDKPVKAQTKQATAARPQIDFCFMSTEDGGKNIYEWSIDSKQSTK